MSPRSRSRLALGLLAGLVAGLAAAAGAQTPTPAPTPTRIRGVIEAVTEQAMTVKSRSGDTLVVALAPTLGVSAVTRVALADIKVGTFVGTAAVRQPDGTFKALEVLVFPDAMRGTGEGHYPWDLTPDSTMTNATVETVVSQVDGPLLTLTYKGGAAKVVVPPDAPVVTVAPGDRSLLVPGAAVFLSAARAADGTLSAARVLVGKDGVVPPM